MTDKCISPLRQRMIEDMTVRNFVPKTGKVTSTAKNSNDETVQSEMR